MTNPAPAKSPLHPALVALIGLAGGIAGALLVGSGLLPLPHGATDKAVHDYILSHPEVLPEAMENLHQQENGKLLSGVRGSVETPWPGAIIGNPKGKQILVEFIDFACGYCKRSVTDVEQLVAANPELKVVVRELPILSPASSDAAKMALAAADQGKYAAFHKAMFETGRPDGETIAAAAKSAGLDPARAARFLADPKLQAEIDHNLSLAQQLGINGTPSWIAGNHILSGAIGKEELARALDKARAEGAS